MCRRHADVQALRRSYHRQRKHGATFTSCLLHSSGDRLTIQMALPVGMMLLLTSAPVFAQDAYSEGTPNQAVADVAAVRSEPAVAPSSGGVVSSELALRSPSAIPRDSPRQEGVKTWYGWQTLTVDAAVPALIALSITTNTEELMAGALGGYLLGGPVTHALHGNWAQAGWSLSMRVVLPVATGGIAYAATSCEDVNSETSDGWCGFGQAIATGLAGLAAASIASAIDASVLAWERHEP